MKRYGKKLTAALLALCIVLELAACGGDNKDGSNTNQLSGTIYVPQYISLDSLQLDYVRNVCSDGTYIFIMGQTETAVVRDEAGEVTQTLDKDFDYDSLTLPEGSYVDYISDQKIYRIGLEEGAELQVLPDYTPLTVPEGMEGSNYSRDMIADSEGTLWVTENLYYYNFDLPEDFDPENDDKWNYMTEQVDKTYMRQLDSDGAELDKRDISSLQETLGENTYINTTLLAPDGNMYLLTNQYDPENGGRSKMFVIVIDSEMKTICSLECPENSWGELVLLGDGTVGYRSSRTSDTPDSDGNYSTENFVQIADAAAKAWGDEYPLPYNCYNIYAGSETYFFYYVTNDTVYGYNKETKEGTELLTWSSADINSNFLEFFRFLSDGRVLTFSRDYSSREPKYEVAVLTETDASVRADKTILTYACLYTGYDTRNQIIQFNRSSDKYRIEIVDYSQFNTEDDYSAGLTQLNTDIGAGKVPDILSTSSLPVSRYGAAGILEDLWPFIENDPDLGRDALMDRPLTAAEQDGKLYQIFSEFYMLTVVGATSVVGDRTSWTLADMQAALDTMPEGCMYFGEDDTKANMLSNILSQNLNQYIDWATGECHFNTPEFVSILEFCNTFPLEFDWENVNQDTYESDDERIMNGKQMLMTTYADFQYIQVIKKIFGGDISFPGFPREDGSVGSCFSISQGAAMSSTCKDKDGAWSFLRTILLPQYDEDTYFGGSGFSINKQDFDKMVKELMTPKYEKDENGELVLDENGNPIEYSNHSWGYGNNQSVDIMATTQEEYDQIMALYNSITSVSSYDQEIGKIVNDVAAGYFNGDRTAEDTAGQIQDRVMLYVNETK